MRIDDPRYERSREGPLIPADTKRDLFILTLSLGIVALITTLFFVLEELPSIFFILIHIFVASVSIAWLVISFFLKDDLRLPMLLAISALTLGPFGIFGFLAMILLLPLYRRLATPFSKWYASLFPAAEDSLAEKIAQRIESGWDNYTIARSFLSYHDLFKLGSITQKQAVLESITVHFTFHLSPILLEALDDPNNIIRIQAASIMAKIDEDFDEMRLYLKWKCEDEPENIQHVLALAHHIDAFASSGLLDLTREQEYRRESLRLYKRCLQMQPLDDEALEGAVKQLLKLSNPSEAAQLLRERLEHSLPLQRTLPLLYLEALYDQRQFHALRLAARQMSGQLPSRADSQGSSSGIFFLWSPYVPDES